MDRAVAEIPYLPRAFDLDFALTSGIHFTSDEVDVEEFAALKALRVARTKHQEEQIRNRPAS